MTTDTRDALLTAVLTELSSLRDYGAISDDNGYGTLSTTFVREHCDRIEAALRTPHPESDAKDAEFGRWCRKALTNPPIKTVSGKDVYGLTLVTERGAGLSADHWLQAAQECPDIASEWIEQRARELARQGMGKP